MKSLLQSNEWTKFKVATGWQSFEIEEINILCRKLFLNKSFLYIPEVEVYQLEKLLKNIAKIQKIAKENKAIFIRVEILDENSKEIVDKLKGIGFVKSFEEVQPEFRQIIDISKTEEEILAGMKEKGRYNIRVAQKHGVVVQKTQKIDDFYKIFTDTARRDGFQIRPKIYFDKLLNILEPHDYAELLVASYNGNIIAAEIVTYYKETASYLYGASSNTDRQVMAPYLLHWEAMRRAKEKGCAKYDMLAVNSEGEENHKYAGIGRFKRQFGGRTVHIVGSWDYVYQPIWYGIFKFGEKIRR